MHRILIRLPDVSEEKHLMTTPSPDCDYVKSLVKEYEDKGFIVRFEDLSKYAHLD
jgi:hypothetical protein